MSRGLHAIPRRFTGKRTKTRRPRYLNTRLVLSNPVIKTRPRHVRHKMKWNGYVEQSDITVSSFSVVWTWKQVGGRPTEDDSISRVIQASRGRLAFVHSSIEGSVSHLFIQASRGQTRMGLFKHRRARLAFVRSSIETNLFTSRKRLYRNHSFFTLMCRVHCSLYFEQTGQFFICPLRRLFRSDTKSVY